MHILLANPRGFCAGVDRAIEIVKRACELFQETIYVHHQIVHNRHVVSEFEQRGVQFVKSLDEIPANSIAIFSAHGVAQDVRQRAAERGLRIFDATCPLVTKVHLEVARYSRLGQECILIGHRGHPEVAGTLGQYNNPEGGIYLIESQADVAELQVKNPELLAYVTQTTLSVDDTLKIIDTLRERFPKIMGPRRDDICYATQNRQDVVKVLAERSDIVIVVGSKNSSNSNRLKELAERLGCDSYLIDAANEMQLNWFENKKVVGVTAGASAPEILVQQVVAKLKEWGGELAEEIQGQIETIEFALPKELRREET